jgi:2-methylcitrate dehydratase PrpD
MQKIEVVENAEYTGAYQSVPQEHHARIIVALRSGERLEARAGGDQDDLATPKSDSQIEQKFRALTEDFLGANRASAILERLWRLEDSSDIAEIAPSVTIA